MRERGLDAVIARRVAEGRTVLGICGGYQMLAESVDDQVESGAGRVGGLGLLPTDVVFGADKVLALPTGQWWGRPVSGYEIHHGVSTVREGSAGEPFLDGWHTGSVWGTMWHGTLENDDFRRAWLAQVATAAGARWAPRAGVPTYAELRERMIDRLADAIETHCDVAGLLRLVGVDA